MREIFDNYEHIRYVCILTQQNIINTLPLDDLYHDLSVEESRLMREKLEIHYIRTPFAKECLWHKGFLDIAQKKYSNNLVPVDKFKTILFEESGDKIVQNNLANFHDTRDQVIIKSVLIINIGGGQKQQATGLYASATAYALLKETETSEEVVDGKTTQKPKIKPSIIICYPDATPAIRKTTWEYLFDSNLQLAFHKFPKRNPLITPFESSLSVIDICNLHYNRKQLQLMKPFTYKFELSELKFPTLANLLDYEELRLYYFMKMAASSRYHTKHKGWTKEISLSDAIDNIKDRKNIIREKSLEGKKMKKYDMHLDEENNSLSISTKGNDLKTIFFDLIDPFINTHWKITWANLVFAKLPFQFKKASPPGFSLPTGPINLDTHDYRSLLTNCPEILYNHSLGSYFELLVLQKLSYFIKNNPEHYIKEVLFQLKVEGAYSNIYAEFDIAISTIYGSLLLIECKSNKFPRKEVAASIKKAQELGGIYVQYICVIPTLGLDPSKEEGPHVTIAKGIWDNHQHLSASRSNTYFLKNHGDSDTKEWDELLMNSFEWFLKQNLLPKPQNNSHPKSTD